MNALDIVIVVITGFCLIRGIFRGLTKELSSIVGVLGGFYGAYTYYPFVARLLGRWISDAVYLNIVSFFIIFCAVLGIISIAAIIIQYLLNIAFLGWVDRICGAGFGFLKAVLIASVMVVALTAFLPRGAGVLKQSVLAPHVMHVSERMAKVISQEMRRNFSTKLTDLKSNWHHH